MTMNRPSGRDFRALVTASWPLCDSLYIDCDIADSTPGTLTVAIEFFEDRIALGMSKSGEAILAEYEVCVSGKLADGE